MCLAIRDLGVFLPKRLGICLNERLLSLQNTKKRCRLALVVNDRHLPLALLIEFFIFFSLMDFFQYLHHFLFFFQNFEVPFLKKIYEITHNNLTSFPVEIGAHARNVFNYLVFSHNLFLVFL